MNYEILNTWLTKNAELLASLAAVVTIAGGIWAWVSGAGKRIAILANRLIFGKQESVTSSTGAPAPSHPYLHRWGILNSVQWAEPLWRKGAAFILRVGTTAGRAVHAAIYWLYYVTPGLNYEVPDAEPSKDPRDFARMKKTTVWFNGRFADAFPGIGDTTEFTDARDIAHRLGILLRHPLFAENSERAQVNPIWWTRGIEDLHLTRWYHLKPRVFVMNVDELAISKIIAVPGKIYWQKFVYVECGAQSPIGLYDYPPELIETRMKQGRSMEEAYAVYNFRPYTERQYADNGYERGGRVRHFRHSPDLRVRHLTKYNFLIVPYASPARAPAVESTLNDFLDSCLDGTKSPQELILWLLHLRRWFDGERFEE